MRIKVLMSLLIISLLLVYCKSETKVESDNGRNLIKIENFEEFYSKFYSDSTFQINRIEFPLKGYNSDFDDGIPDDVREELSMKPQEEFMWKKNEWEMLKNVNDENLKKELNKSDTLVVERIYKEASGYEILRKFKPINNKWYLIYYSYSNQ